MATATRWNFVSRSSGANNGMAISSNRREVKANALRVGKRQMVVDEGLRVVYNARVIGARKIQNGNSRNIIICGCGMNLVFVGAEVGPWSKTGGLGDVLGGLPPAMAVGKWHRVMTVSPRYDQYKDAWDTEVELELKAGDRTEKVRFFHCYKRGVDRVFVDHPMFLEKIWGKTASKIYGPVAGIDYQDNQLRFSLLCQAALEAPRVLDLNSSEYFSGPYGEDVVFIANDWHTALIPCYLKSMYKSRGMYMSAKVRSIP